MLSGCGRFWPTVATGRFPQAVAVDQATDTVYVANLGDDTVSVIDGATCNASVTSGCGQSPPAVSVGEGPDGIAVNQATDTIYVANSGDNTVSVIDGAACNARVISGCAQASPVIEVADGPDALAVNQDTDTIYVTSGFFDEFSPSAAMSVIDGATCNAAVTSGCGQTRATMVTGGFSDGVAVDQATDTVFADSIIDSDLEAFDAATCNATDQSGCGQTPASVPVGGWPANLALNPATGTIYVPDNVDGQVSIVAARDR
jgi:YVTN family beta-propeller protein